MFGFKSLPERVDGTMARILYDTGVLLQVPVSYTMTGPYELCNEESNGTYTCRGSSPYVGIAGSGGGAWYSFPQAGEGTYWHQGDCPSKTITLPVRAVVDELADAGHCDCPKQGSDPEEVWKACAVCIVNMSDVSYTSAFLGAFGRPRPLSAPEAHGAQLVV
jgi:hypothetical protein